MTEEQAQQERKAPKGARLPQVAIEQVLPVARALHELGAASTVQRIAQRLQVSPSGGGFRSRVGAAGYFGLIRRVGERRELTSLGERAVGTDGEADAARREAVLATGFRPVFTLFRGRDVSEALIQARLQDDFAVPASASAQIARALVDSGQQTGLITEGRFDAGAIEEALAQSTTQDALPARRRTPNDLRPRPAAPSANAAASPPPGRSPNAQTTLRPSPDVHIDVQIHIPATATTEQIDQIFASMAKHLYAHE